MLNATPWSLRPKCADDTTNRSLFDELYRFVSGAAPGAAVRPSLAARLRVLPRHQRRQLVSQSAGGGGAAGGGDVSAGDGLTPLFVAARDGQLALVRFLLAECGADAEQRCHYLVAGGDRTRHRVTPLWCAAVAGRLAVVRCLCEHGADVNAVSDSGSTPVRSACFMTHVEVVRYLVTRAGANIQLANHSGGTCLINAIQSRPLCQLLLEHGADVNALDVQNKSALHYAIQEHREETVRLLLHHGADPHIVSRAGDDALQTACLKGDVAIFSLLCSKVAYSEARLADAHELLGATLVDEHHDIPAALEHWRLALQIRSSGSSSGSSSSSGGSSGGSDSSVHAPPLPLPLSKRRLPLNPAYLDDREFETFEELNDLRTDWDRVKIQSLIITERILGTDHKDVTFRLMYRGAAYADALMYDRCVSLWLYALSVRACRDAVLFHEVCLSAHALVRLLLDLLQRQPPVAAADNDHHDHQAQRAEGGAGGALRQMPCRGADVRHALRLLVDLVPATQRALLPLPQCDRQRREFELALALLLRLVHVLASTTAGSGATGGGGEWRRDVYRAISRRPVTGAGRSLLHLAVAPLSLSTSQQNDAQTLVLPCARVVRVLVECGADVNAEDEAGVTPLLLCATKYKCCPAEMATIVNILLEAGAHLDQCQRRTRQSPLQLLARAGHALQPLQHVTLRCLAARAVHTHTPLASVPAPFRQFVLHH